MAFFLTNTVIILYTYYTVYIIVDIKLVISLLFYAL